MTLTRMSCECGKLHVEGDVQQPPLARLTGADRRLAEELVACGGNLKTVAEHFEITYPTLRKRLDRVIRKLEDERRKDHLTIENILARMEKGEMEMEEGIQRIGVIKGEL